MLQLMLLTLVELISLVSLSGAGSLSYTFITLAVKLLEKAFYRYGVNVDAFDAESAGKTASSYPRVASVVRLLESHA